MTIGVSAENTPVAIMAQLSAGVIHFGSSARRRVKGRAWVHVKRAPPAKGALSHWYVFRVCASTISHAPADQQAEAADAVSK